MISPVYLCFSPDSLIYSTILPFSPFPMALGMWNPCILRICPRGTAFSPRRGVAASASRRRLTYEVDLKVRG